jgi:hypothetical protein
MGWSSLGVSPVEAGVQGHTIRSGFFPYLSSGVRWPICGSGPLALGQITLNCNYSSLVNVGAFLDHPNVGKG